MSTLPTTPGVYSIFCHVNKKFYVGGAVDVKTRCLNNHRHNLIKGKHPNVHLQTAWNKYGPSQFTFELLESCQIGNLRAREQAWLDSIAESGVPVFNKHFGATGVSKGFKHGPLSERAIVHLNRIHEARKGSKISEWHRRRLSESNRGKTLSPETRRILSERTRVHYEKNGVSEETRKKLSNAARKQHKERRLRTTGRA